MAQNFNAITLWIIPLQCIFFGHKLVIYHHPNFISHIMFNWFKKTVNYTNLSMLLELGSVKNKSLYGINVTDQQSKRCYSKINLKQVLQIARSALFKLNKKGIDISVQNFHVMEYV